MSEELSDAEVETLAERYKSFAREGSCAGDAYRVALALQAARRELAAVRAANATWVGDGATILSERDAAKAQVAALREGAEKVLAAMWDSHYGKGITVEYARTMDRELRPALADTEAAARTYTTQVRRAALEQAAKIADEFAREASPDRRRGFDARDAALGELLSQNIAAAIRALEADDGK